MICGASPFRTTEANPVESAEAAARQTHRTVGKLHDIPAPPILPGFKQFDPSVTATSSVAPIVRDGTRLDAKPREFSSERIDTAAVAVGIAAWSTPARSAEQGPKEASSPLAGNARLAASQQSAAKPAQRPVRQLVLEPAELPSTVALVLPDSVQVDPNGMASLCDVGETAIRSSVIEGFVSEPHSQLFDKVQAAFTPEDLETSSTENEPVASKGTLAFGARVTMTAAAASPDGPAPGGARARLNAAEPQQAPEPAACAARPVIRSGAPSERPHENPGNDTAQRPVFNESAPAAMSPTGGQAPATVPASKPAAAPSAQGQWPLEDSHDASRAPLRELSLKLESTGDTSAQVRLSERNGEIQVAVRASDPRLAESLRINVNELVNNLSRGELTAEIWHPDIAAESPMSSGARQESGGSANLHQQGNSGSSHSDERHGGREGQRQPEWLEELDAAPTEKSVRRNTYERQPLN